MTDFPFISQAAKPLLSDEELFQKARLVVSAEIAKIHTLEWTPTILGLNPVLSSGMDVDWHGLNADIPIPSFDTGLLQVSCDQDSRTCLL